MNCPGSVSRAMVGSRQVSTIISGATCSWDITSHFAQDLFEKQELVSKSRASLLVSFVRRVFNFSVS